MGLYAQSTYSKIHPLDQTFFRLFDCSILLMSLINYIQLQRNYCFISLRLSIPWLIYIKRFSNKTLTWRFLFHFHFPNCNNAMKIIQILPWGHCCKISETFLWTIPSWKDCCENSALPVCWMWKLCFGNWFRVRFCSQNSHDDFIRFV